MKKTTYILIALLAALGVAAFVTPPLVLKRIATVITVMRKSDSIVSLTAGVMATLEINHTHWPEITSLDDTVQSISPTVEVVEIPGLTAPRITASEEWSRQFRIDSLKPMTVTITFDFHGIRGTGEDARHIIRIAPDNMTGCRIEVPEGQLRKLGSHLPVALIGLTGDSLKVECYDRLSMRDCRVASVDI